MAARAGWCVALTWDWRSVAAAASLAGVDQLVPGSGPQDPVQTSGGQHGSQLPRPVQVHDEGIVTQAGGAVVGDQRPVRILS